VTLRHAEQLARLPPHHADPFDRMLIAQARVEGAMIVTHDPQFERYDVPIVHV
jgi:PIN domain nuclease of toxin-antitoxin system